MSLNSQTLEQLFQVFSSNVNTQTRKAAETQLVTLRQTAVNYPVCILELISKSGPEIQLRAAIEFKLWSQQYSVSH